MSEEQTTIANLTAENNRLKEEAAKLNQNIEVLNAQMDAHKGVINENMMAGLNLRTNISLIQKNFQKEAQVKLELQKQIESLTNQLLHANAKINKLENPNALDQVSE